MGNSLTPHNFEYNSDENEYVTIKHGGVPCENILPELDIDLDKCSYNSVNLILNVGQQKVDLLHVPGAWHVDNLHIETENPNTSITMEFVKYSDHFRHIVPKKWVYNLTTDDTCKATIPNRVIFVAYRDMYTDLNVTCTGKGKSIKLCSHNVRTPFNFE